MIEKYPKPPGKVKVLFQVKGKRNHQYEAQVRYLMTHCKLDCCSENTSAMHIDVFYLWSIFILEPSYQSMVKFH